MQPFWNQSHKMASYLRSLSLLCATVAAAWAASDLNDHPIVGDSLTRLDGQ